jgi:hypothetical protein
MPVEDRFAPIADQLFSGFRLDPYQQLRYAAITQAGEHRIIALLRRSY